MQRYNGKEFRQELKRITRLLKNTSRNKVCFINRRPALNTRESKTLKVLEEEMETMDGKKRKKGLCEMFILDMKQNRLEAINYVCFLKRKKDEHTKKGTIKSIVKWDKAIKQGEDYIAYLNKVIKGIQDIGEGKRDNK